MQTVSKTEFAKRMGVSRQYIGKLVKAGKLPQLPNGKLDADECAIIYQTNTNQSDRNNQNWIKEQKGKGAVKAAEDRSAKGAPVPGGANKIEDPTAGNYGISYQKARAAKEAVKARKEQIELFQLENKLIDVQSIKQQIETISNTVRTRLNKFPSKYAGRLEGLTTVEIQETLEVGIYEILSEFKDMLTGASETATKK